jgi:hypothetical protein
MRGRNHKILGDATTRRIAALKRLQALKVQSEESKARGISFETWKKNLARTIKATIANLPEHMQKKFL